MFDSQFHLQVSTREPSAKTKSKNDVQVSTILFHVRRACAFAYRCNVTEDIRGQRFMLYRRNLTEVLCQARNLFQGGAGHEKVYLQSKDPKLVQMWFQALNLGQKTTATPLFSRVPSSDLRRASTTRQTSMNARSGAAHQPLNANKLAQELKLAQETGTKSNKKKVRNGNGNVGRTRSRSASPRSGQTLTAQKLAQELRLAQEIDKMLHLRKQKSRAGAGDFSRTRSRSASPSVQGAHGRMQDNVAAKESGVQRTSYERGRPKTRCA
jgi:hypothetical protein